MIRIVGDLGNTRLKLAQFGDDGRIATALAVPTDDPTAWAEALRPWGAGPSHWAIASVNPPAADRLAHFLAGYPEAEIRWFHSASQVPVRNALERLETAGTDRALAVLAAVEERGGKGPGLLVMCGTAVTVERIAADGVWQGGAIAAGLGLTARGLHTLTALLPLIAPRAEPPAWGRSTISALEAGIFWGVTGAVRELLTRQAEGFPAPPWVVWTGGDAPALAPAVNWPGAKVIPDLVLRGLADIAFGHDPR